MTSRLICLAFAAVSLTVASDPASGLDAAGYVAAIDRPADAPRPMLQRDGKSPSRLVLGMILFNGDIVIVTPPASVRIDVVGGRAIQLCGEERTAADCRLRIVGGSTLSPWPMADRLARMIGWFEAQGGVNAVTRNAATPQVKIGAGTPQNLVAGERDLWIGWVDGAPPFAVHVERNGMRLAESRTEARRLVLPAIQLPLGEAMIVIVDDSGRRATLPVRVVEGRPTVEDAVTGAVDADHAALLRAATLAATGSGEWALEAVQGLDGPADRVPAIEAFRSALTVGMGM